MKPTTSLFRAIVIAACMLAAALYLAHASRAEVIPPREPLLKLPMQFDDWRGRREPDLTGEIVTLLGVDDYIYRSYTRGSDAASLYVGYHTTQREGDTIHSPLNCLPGAGWQPLEQGRTHIPVRQSTAPGAAAPIEVNRVVIGKGLGRQLVVYWYQSHRRVVASEYWGKVYTVLDAVRYNRTDAALVRVVVPIRSDAQSAAESAAIDFIKSLYPRLTVHFP
jgi:EpsI family protein